MNGSISFRDLAYYEEIAPFLIKLHELCLSVQADQYLLLPTKSYAAKIQLEQMYLRDVLNLHSLHQ